MKRILFILAAAVMPLAAQPGCVSLVDTVYSVGTPGPAKMNGTIDLALGYTAIDGTFTVVESAGRQTVSGGALSACPVPGSYTASYTVRLQAPMTGTSTFDRYWVIPTGVSGPYRLSDVPTAQVNVSDTAVTWVSGITFGSVSPGDTLLIGGNSFAVSTVNSLTSLTLVTSAGKLMNATLSDGPIERQTFPSPFPATISGPAGPTGSSSLYVPWWMQVSGLPAGSWAYNYNQKGEHAVIHAGKLYAPLEDRTGTYQMSGIGEFDPATGQELRFVSIPTPCMEAAPAFDASGNMFTYSCSNPDGTTGNFVTKVALSTFTVTGTYNPGSGATDWEKVPYDATNDLVLIAPEGAGLRAIHASDLSVAWTNSDVDTTTGCGGSCGNSPVLINGGYAYWTDHVGKLWKIRLADGITVASQAAVGTGGYVFRYANMSLDTANNRIFLANGANTVYCVDAGDLHVVWSQSVDSTAFYFMRGGAYNNGVYFATDRQNGSNFASKIWAFNADTGAVLWSNTTALDNEAQISGLLVDDTYVYATTHGHDTKYFNELLVINRSNGTLAESQQLFHDVSSSIPAVYGGRIIIGLWDNFGYEAIRIRQSGTTGDWLYKADSAMTGYIGTAASGALSILSSTFNTAPPGGVLVSAPNPVGQTAHQFIGTCGDLPIAEYMPCSIQPADLAPNPNNTLFLRGDGTWAAPTATAAAGGSNGQVQYNCSGLICGFTPTVNNMGLTTPSAMNFADSAATNGLTYHFSNPAGGTIQLSVTGTLDNTGLSHPSWTLALPSWLAGGGTVALGATATISAATGQASHQVIGTCGVATSFAPCSLQPGDIPTLNQNTTGNAATATALQSNPSDCAPNQYANTIDAGGNLTCSQVAYSQLSGVPPTFAPASHNLLSTSHGDTTASAAIRGGGIFAVGATPTWQQVAHSAATGGYFKWNGTDIVASTGAAGGTGPCASHQFETTDNADASPTCTQPAFSDLSGTAIATQLPSNNRLGGFSVMFRGSDATAGTTLYLTIPYACTVTDLAISGDSTASIKVWRIADGGTALPTVTNSISSAAFQLSTGTLFHSSTPASYLSSLALAAYDTLGINLFASASTHVEFTLGCLR